MKFGVDYLAAVKYINTILKTHPTGWAAGVMLRTFGNARSVIQKFADSKKFVGSDIVVHLAPFDYSHRYPIKSNRAQVLADAEWIQKLAEDYTDRTFMLSPFCEHNHPSSRMEPFLNQIRETAPSCLLVNSIWKGDAIPDYITELHVVNSKPMRLPSGQVTIAFDGFGGDGSGDFPDADVPTMLKRFSGARHVRLWNFRYNGKFGHKDKSDIKNRKSWPGEHYMRGHNAMMKLFRAAPTLPPDRLLKPFADDHGGGPETKDNKMMCIMPQSAVGGAKKLDVFDSENNKVDTMTRFDPPHPNDPPGPRFYSKKSAYQVGNLAEKNTGQRTITILNKVTDPDLRSGKFK